jgi:hypothetical protein
MIFGRMKPATKMAEAVREESQIRRTEIVAAGWLRGGEPVSSGEGSHGLREMPAELSAKTGSTAMDCLVTPGCEVTDEARVNSQLR